MKINDKSKKINEHQRKITENRREIDETSMPIHEKPLKIEDILISLGEAARRANRWSSLYNRHSLSAKEK